MQQNGTSVAPPGRDSVDTAVKGHEPAPGAESLPLWAEIFHGLPSGILVTDRERRLVAANGSARELLDTGMREGTEAACCQLLGCREPGTPLASACLTELALGATGPLPEIRLDVPPETKTGATWVTASPLGSDPTFVVMQLRQGARGDRRRRTEPHWLGERRLRICVLGRTGVESGEGSIGGSWLEQRPGQLLKYLIMSGDSPSSSDEIAAALWPGSGAEALNTVRHYVHVLRQKLEPGRPKRSESSFVMATPSGYFIDRLRVEIDADLFEQRVRTGIAAYVSGEAAIAARSLQEAMSLYSGDFLADEPYAEWALFERDRLRELAGRACRALIEQGSRVGDLDTAAEYGERLVELDPFDVEVQRAVLLIALRRGRRSEALRRYGTMRRRTLSEFGEDLPFDLSELTKAPGEAISLL